MHFLKSLAVIVFIHLHFTIVAFLFFCFQFYFTRFDFLYTVIVMNPNLAIANKVCMVILNFEVINSYRLLALLNIMCFNDKIFTVNTYEFITYEKTFCLDKSSALYIEWVIVSSYYLLTVYCKMNKLVYLTFKCFKNGFLTDFK